MGSGDKSGRRGFISRIGVAAGAIAVAAPQRAIAQHTGRALGVVPEQSIGRWKIATIYGVHFGAVPVVLEDASGERFQVDVLRRDPDPARPDGVGNTDVLSVYVANRGDGDTATHEEQGLAAMALADALAVGDVTVPEGLLTFSERLVQHPGEAYSVPLV